MRPHLRRSLAVGVTPLIIAVGIGALASTLRWPIGLAGAAVALALTASAHSLLSTIGGGVVRPLQELGAALSAVGRGDLGHDLPADLPREFDPIIDSYQAMCASLRAHQQVLGIQMRRTSLLTQLSIELRETLDPTTIAERVLRVIGGNQTIDEAIMIISGGGAQSLRWADGGISPLDPARAARMVDYGLEGWVQRQGSSTVLGDLSRAEHWLAGGGSPQGSAIVLALRQSDASLGSLTIYARQPNAFTNHDMLLMEGVVAQTAVALSAAWSYQDERQRRDQAMALLAMSQFLTSERSHSDIAALLEDHSRTLFAVAHGLLYLRLPGTELRPLPIAPAPADLSPEQLMRASQAAAAASDSRQISMRSDPPGDQPHSYIALPLINAGNVLGACVLVQPPQSDASFSANVWSLLTIFTNQIAAACANIQLIGQLRQYATQLEALVSRRTDELQRSRDLLRVVFDNLPEGLMLLDAQGVLLAANNAFCRGIVGCLPRDLVGMQYRALWDTLARQSQLRLTPQGPAAGDGAPASPADAPIDLRPSSWRVSSSDLVGQERWYEVERTMILSGDGAAVQCLERWRDITYQEELQRRLMLHEQLTSLGRLAASVAHEVGNPLQSALGCLELCREANEIGPLTREYLELALGELDRMARTMDSLRNLYRPPQLTWEQVDLNQLMRQVAKFTQRQLAQKKIQLALELDPELPPITGQPDALRQVFLNLILNAQEAMHQGGNITISTASKPTDRACRVQIRDTGAGMREDQLARIFEPFNSQKAQGVGLGLYLSHQIIGQHTGHIAISSQPGQGTTVTVHIPWSDLRLPQTGHRSGASDDS